MPAMEEMILDVEQELVIQTPIATVFDSMLHRIRDGQTDVARHVTSSRG